MTAPFAPSPSPLRSRELRFVRDLVAEGLGRPPPAPEPVRGLDWDRVLFLLSWHGLDSWVLHVEPPRLAEVPARRREQLRQRRLVNAVRVEGHLAFLDALQSRLAREGVPLLVLKGIGLSLRHYGDPAVRSCGDLDVLVPRCDLPRVHALMEPLGYALRAQTPAGTDPFAWASWHEKGLVYRSRQPQRLPAEDRPLEVEVHHRPAPYPANHAPPESVFSEGPELESGGRRLRILPPPHQLANLLQHGAISRWARFKWVIDVERELGACGLGASAPLPAELGKARDVARAYRGFAAIRDALLLDSREARPHRLVADEWNDTERSVGRSRSPVFLVRALDYELSLAGSWRHRGQILWRRLQRLAEVPSAGLPAPVRALLWPFRPLVRAYVRVAGARTRRAAGRT